MEQWSLQPLGTAQVGVGYVQRVERSGIPAFLKINPPEDAPTSGEADALSAWGGVGAVLLLERDDARNAFLVEACEPGSSLADLDDRAATDVTLDLIRTLDRTPPLGLTFRLLEVEAMEWGERLRTGPAGASAVDAHLQERAAQMLDELLDARPPRVLLHGDLHTGNILRAQRRPWLAIDPKPLVGDPCFEPAVFIRDPALIRRPGAEHRVHDRVRRMADELGLDAARVSAWAVVDCVASALGQDTEARLRRQCARWLLS